MIRISFEFDTDIEAFAFMQKVSETYGRGKPEFKKPQTTNVSELFEDKMNQITDEFFNPKHESNEIITTNENMKECAICGNLFEKKGPKKCCSDECTKKYRAKYAREYYHAK